MKSHTKDLLVSIGMIIVVGAMATIIMFGVDRRISVTAKSSYEKGRHEGYLSGVELVWRCQRLQSKGLDMLRYNDGECVNALLAGDRY